MQPVKNPCTCVAPQRHEYCHCEGRCAKGDAYKKYSEYRAELNKQNYLKQLMPARNIKVCPSKWTGNL